MSTMMDPLVAKRDDATTTTTTTTTTNYNVPLATPLPPSTSFILSQSEETASTSLSVSSPSESPRLSQPLSSRQHHQPRRYSLTAVGMIFVVPALVGFLFGYEIGATSYAVLQLMGSQGGGLSGVSFSLNGKPALTGLVVSAPSAGALLGTSIVFGIADVIGRRMELRIAGILYFVGALCEYSTVFIHTHPSSSWVAVATLMSARIVYGTGIGFAMHGAPTYLGEMCPSDIRGALVSLKEVAIVLGILCGYVIGYSFLHVYRGWAYTYLMTIVVSVTVILLSFKIPYSARWLVSHGRDEEALDALEFVWEPNQARCELQSMIQSRDSQHQRQRQQGLEEARVEGDLTTLQSISSTPDPIADHQRDNKSIFDPSRRAALTAGVGLVALQQITGQPSVLSYATPILVSAGLSSFSSVLIALFKVLATSLAVIFVEKSGRRLLLMIGCSLMFVSLVVLTTTFYGATIEGRRKTASTLDGDGDDKRLDVRNTFILAAMFVYIGGYQIGFGPIAWLIIAEVFPQEIRGKAVALAVQTNFFLNAVVQVGVPVLEARLGLSFTFGMFAVLTAYSVYFVYTKVPETKGLSLEQIEAKFAAMTPTATRRVLVSPSNADVEELTQLLST